MVIGTAIFILVYVVIEVAMKRPDNLRSAAGVAAFVLIFYVFSYKPAKVTMATQVLLMFNNAFLNMRLKPNI